MSVTNPQTCPEACNCRDALRRTRNILTYLGALFTMICIGAAIRFSVFIPAAVIAVLLAMAGAGVTYASWAIFNQWINIQLRFIQNNNCAC